MPLVNLGQRYYFSSALHVDTRLSELLVSGAELWASGQWIIEILQVPKPAYRSPPTLAFDFQLRALSVCSPYCRFRRATTVAYNHLAAKRPIDSPADIEIKIYYASAKLSRELQDLASIQAPNSSQCSFSKCSFTHTIPHCPWRGRKVDNFAFNVARRPDGDMNAGLAWTSIIKQPLIVHSSAHPLVPLVPSYVLLLSWQK